MARTTVPDVIAVLGADYDAGDNNTAARSLTPFIRAAHLLTNRIATYAAGRGVSVSDAELTEIECWLAAHAYTRSDRPYSETTVLNAKAVFQGKTGMGFDASDYGRFAKSLDPSGLLAAMDAGGGKVATAGMTWLGKTPSQQIDYDSRD